ncbi:serine/threonine-protein kinase [Amycolatopsis magusensis]|uniref:non-specific serine/threonine protein kinase n=1 Tax=Amycolatopsis magusensis TaxID=882444 RepID=A0ABS4Q407_9PSEU|nr:serine/threonine-protein kinase [Amycolatopsis magusensis]MBP2186328.1 hypothetical protein [Amycolatopsis magusensis]
MSSADDTLPRFDLPELAEEPVCPALVAGRYRLLSKTGAGTSAVVYRAIDLEAGHDVAVKLFHPGIAGKDFLRREREFRVLADLHHPGLVEFRDSGFDLDRAYLVMQLVDGPTVAGRILCGPLTAAETTQLGIGIAEALAYVHSRGITHRDLKPANILLAGDRPLLTDFGLAYRLGTSDLTSSGAVVGTAAYMAPEQVRGKEVGPPADIYALGLILLECLTGYREYPGAMVESALARLSRTPEIPDFVGPMLSALLTRMTDEDPRARPTAAQVAAALLSPEAPTAITRVIGRLTAEQADAPTLVTKPVPMDQPPVAGTKPLQAGKPPKRRRKVVLSAAIPAAALAVAGIFALANSGGSQGFPADGTPHSTPAPPPVVEAGAPVGSATLSPGTGQPVVPPVNAQPQGGTVPVDNSGTPGNSGPGKKDENRDRNNGKGEPAQKQSKKDN